MIGEIFKALFITSLAGSALAGVISLFRPITKKLFGYSWHYYIWLCVLFVMLMPVRFAVNPTPASSITTQTVQTEQTEKTNVSEQPETTETIVQTDTAQKPQLLQKAAVIWGRIIYNRMNILAYLWLIGAVALILLNVARYIWLNINIRKNGKIISCPEIGAYTDRKINVRAWGNIASPFMTGVFRPTLILPETELSDEQLHNILRHEMTHFKRHDILYKWFAEFVKCVHWFNPVAWYVSKQIAVECEISCDMAVTKNMSGSEEMSYINTILSLLPTGKSKQLPLTTQMASSKKILKRRFIMIKNKKTTSRFMSVISAVIAVAMLSTTVFASGIIQNSFAPDDIKYEVYNGDNKIALKNEPFIYGSEYYLPLRDILGGFGVNDIVYADGEIKIKFPTYMTKNNTEEIMLKIGDALIHYNPVSSKEYGVVMRCAPVLHNNVTYVTVDYFEDMMRSFDMQGFRLNVIRPTEPENYYAKDEKVFIGTAEEQDSYSGELVKRIIVDEKGETIAVVPIENQISENIQRKTETTGIWSTYNSFYHMLYDSATSIYDFAEKTVFKSELYVIDKNDNDIAYIGIADIIRIPQNKFNVGNRMIITNTYNAYDKSSNEINLQPFSDEEVAAARAVVEEYFKAANEKGKRGELKTLTSWHNASNVVLNSDIDAIVTLNDIQYDASDPEREGYVTNGRGSVYNVTVDDVIVFRVDYAVSVPQGGDAGAYSEGNYSDWKMILIRDDKNGKWFIDDMGY
mgnify:CR=1 FL=1